MKRKTNIKMLLAELEADSNSKRTFTIKNNLRNNILQSFREYVLVNIIIEELIDEFFVQHILSNQSNVIADMFLKRINNGEKIKIVKKFVSENETIYDIETLQFINLCEKLREFRNKVIHSYLLWPDNYEMALQEMYKEAEFVKLKKIKKYCISFIKKYLLKK